MLKSPQKSKYCDNLASLILFCPAFHNGWHMLHSHACVACFWRFQWEPFACFDACQWNVHCMWCLTLLLQDRHTYQSEKVRSGALYYCTSADAGLQDFSVRWDFYWSQSIASFSRSPPLKCPCTWQIFLEVRTDPNEIIHLVENLQNKNGRSVLSGELLTWPNMFCKSFIWLLHLARAYSYPHYPYPCISISTIYGLILQLAFSRWVYHLLSVSTRHC